MKEKILFWQKDIETMPRKEIEALQLARLKTIVKFCMDNIPFYNKSLSSCGVSDEKIKCLSDIQYIPFTTKEDIRDNYPFGFFGTPNKKIVRIHASSGTTGKPTVVGYTKSDLNVWSDLVARICAASGAFEDDTAQIMFGYGLFTGALGLHYGLEKLGVSVIPSSSGNTEKQIMLMKDLGTTLLISTPSYALHIAEIMKEMHITRDQIKLRLGILGSEGCTAEMRNQVEAGLGVFVTDNYGMSEIMGPGVSGECIYRNGLHLAEDHFLPELINSDTCAPVKGEDGELVITTLTKEGFPMLRYRTKDLTSLNYEVCECGRTHVRMDKIKGRSDDMLKIKGVNVFPTQIESVLLSVEYIGPHYQLIVRRDGAMDNMEVKVELLDGSLLDSYSQLEDLNKKIRHNLRTVLGLDCKVTLCEPQSLERYIGKAKRVLDLRNEK